MTAQRPAAGRRADSGVTLVEMLVAMIVTTVLLGLVGTVLSSTVVSSRRAANSVTATAEARFAMDVVGRRLRVAVRPLSGGNVVTEATSGSVTFTASLTAPGSTADPAPSTVRYAVDVPRRCLLETITAPSGTTRSTCLALGDVTPVFSYYQVTRRPTAVQPSPSPAPTSPLPLGTTGLSTTDLPLVGAVELQLSVRARGASTARRPVVLRSRFLLVNDLNEERT